MKIKNRGFSLVEVILAGSIFILFVMAISGALTFGTRGSYNAGLRSRAILLAEEGLEVVRNIRDAGFQNLTQGTFGLDISTNQPALVSNPDQNDYYTRYISISNIDDHTKEIKSEVKWTVNGQESSVYVITRLTDWRSFNGAGDTCNI